MRAMERLRAHWQSIADRGSLVILRCDGDGDGFHALRLKPPVKMDIEGRSEPGSPFAASLHIGPFESNRFSRRANAIRVPKSSRLEFNCFETPEAARKANEDHDFQTRSSGRVQVVLAQDSFQGTYWLENGVLVLDSGPLSHRIQKFFDPAWQPPDSPWLKAFRFPV